MSEPRKAESAPEAGAPDNAEDEITPEMTRAGASVLYGMELAFASEDYWAKEVYCAMRRVRSQS
jgi:hypothetical protein